MYHQTKEEIEKHIENSVLNIAGICELFDAGNSYISFLLAAEIHKVLTTGKGIASIRGDMRFPTVDFEYSPGNLMAEHKLIIAQQTGQPDREPPFYVDFIGVRGDSPFPIKWLPFRDWWNRDVIYRASAASQATPTGHLPTDVRLHTPREKRFLFTRRTLIEQIRNKLGAHIDREVPEELIKLQKANSFGIGIFMNVDGVLFNTVDGSMPMKTDPGSAMVRQIAHELLEAFRLSKQTRP